MYIFDTLLLRWPVGLVFLLRVLINLFWSVVRRLESGDNDCFILDFLFCNVQPLLDLQCPISFHSYLAYSIFASANINKK